jgi:hypothetical protein
MIDVDDGSPTSDRGVDRNARASAPALVNLPLFLEDVGLRPDLQPGIR